ncbi:MAG TPA: hypothetical protein DD730_19310 [Desulfosporosinus sp.]|nr:hypothetical protein [Desulfosporosinus sp.]
MQRDAHYYAILAFCRSCGFKKESAQVVAHASQYVDDAKIDLMYLNKSSHVVDHDVIDDQPAFFNMATCHSYFRINTFNYESMINNTIAYHFVPGCEGENFTKKLRTKEEAPIILDILNDVFVEDNLYTLGIVLHTFADSYTHQGFSGMLSKVNDINNCEAKAYQNIGLYYKMLDFFAKFSPQTYDKLFDRIMPAYGHGQALEFPDIPFLKWSYEYDYSDEFHGSYKKVEIDNKDRYQRAFQSIRQHLENYLIKHPQYFDWNLNFHNFDLLLDTLLLEDFEGNKREENWKKLLIEQGLYSKEDLDLIIYDNSKWLKEAFSNYDKNVFDNRTVDGVQLANNFLNSHWYQYYLSVKWYKEKFIKYCAKYQFFIPS